MNAPVIKPAMDQPHGLWSLWDMLRVHAEWFVSVRRYVERQNKTLAGRPHEEQLAQHEKIALKSNFEQIQSHCDTYGLPDSAENARYIAFFAHTTTVGKCLADIEKFDYALETELSKIIFFSVSGDDASLFQVEKPFGDRVYDAFPSTRLDVTEAAKCFALDRSTACVFHCMRVLESALRILAKDVKVVFDIQTWQTVIEQIENAIRAEGKALPSGTTKTERLHRLSEAAKEFVYFKDGWRNHVSHNRSPYDPAQAASAFNHTKDFMRSLSQWLK